MPSPCFLSVCLNPTFQRTLLLPTLAVGEVNRSNHARLDVSGKGINVCRVLKQLGASARNLTHLGPGGDLFSKICRDEDLEISSFPSVSPVRTCITLIDEENQGITELVEPTEGVENSAGSRVSELFQRLLASSDWVIISGSRAPGYPDYLYADFCDLARQAGVPVLVDYRGKELKESLKKEPDVVKINLVEFCATFLPEIEVNEQNDEHALESVQEKLTELSRGAKTCYAVTRGARDCLVAKNGEITRMKIPENKRPIVNTIGSGDATAAGIAFAMLVEGSDFQQAVARGLECGSRNAQCLKPGSIF